MKLKTIGFLFLLFTLITFAGMWLYERDQRTRADERIIRDSIALSTHKEELVRSRATLVRTLRGFDSTRREYDKARKALVHRRLQPTTRTIHAKAESIFVTDSVFVLDTAFVAASDSLSVSCQKVVQDCEETNRRSDSVIIRQDTLIVNLQKRAKSKVRRMGDFAIGAVVGILSYVVAK